MKHPREHVMQKCTCIESAEMISALNRRASSTESFVLPVPVDPSITIKGSFRNIFLTIFHYTWTFSPQNIFMLQKLGVESARTSGCTMVRY